MAACRILTCKGHGPDATFHGKFTGYQNHGCRCDLCTPVGRARHRAAYAASPEKYSARQTFYKMGVTPERYEEMLTEQGGRCAICRSENPGTNKKFAIDHDHSCCPGRKSCGKCIRGLLCQKCNRGLGLFNDDPERLRAAVRFLLANL